MKRLNIHKGFLFIWICSACLAFYLYFQWHITKDFAGIVESNTHLVGARESGMVQSILVSINDHVSSGQIVAKLDNSDLEYQLKQLKRALEDAEKLESAHRTRFALEYQQMILTLENEASDQVERLSYLESKSTELASLNDEINRLEAAAKAGLGRDRDLADLVLRRNALTSFLSSQSEEYQRQRQKRVASSESRLETESISSDSILDSLLAASQEYISELKIDISAIEDRIRARTLIAPCTGVVANLLVYPGDSVEAFFPVMEIKELHSNYLNMYLPETSSVVLEPGMETIIYSSRDTSYSTTGTITFVHPDFTEAPERLSIRSQEFWARAVRVSMDENHSLIPGEVVQIRVKPKGNSWFEPTARAEESRDTTDLNAPKLLSMQTMKLPVELENRSRFEPSGILWIREWNQFLVISDDTGLKDTTSEHAPWLFRMNSDGVVVPGEVALTGIKTINDLEAITAGSDGMIYLVSSQNISKKGKRPVSREQIFAVECVGNQLVVKDSISFLSMILQCCSATELAGLGLKTIDKDGKPQLNIEAAAYWNDALFLGLKSPMNDQGALIWKLDNLKQLFQTHQLQNGQLSLFAQINVSVKPGEQSGFSDLAFDRSGKLWALSTIPGDSPNKQTGGLFRLDRFEGGQVKPVLISTFEGVKPEGLSFTDDGRYMIVIDNDNRTPLFCTGKGDTL